MKLHLVGRRSHACWHLALQVFFVVYSGDFHDLRVSKEWLIDELSDDGGKLNLSTNLFHRMLLNETYITLYIYIILSNLRKKQGKNLGYFQILIIRKKSMDFRKSSN